jgi:hypothetical protein
MADTQFQLKDGRVISVDPSTLSPEQKAKLRDLIAPGPPSLLQRPEPQGLETGLQPNQPPGRPMGLGGAARVAGDTALGFFGGGGLANPLSGGLNAYMSMLQSMRDVTADEPQDTMGPSRAGDITSSLLDLATSRIPGAKAFAAAKPWMTDVGRGVAQSGAVAGEMAREGEELTPETLTSLGVGGVLPPAITGGMAQLTRRALPKSGPMVRERLENEIPALTGTRGEPGIAPGTPMDPNVRATFQRATEDLSQGIPAIEAQQSLQTGAAQLRGTEAQQASARTLPVMQAGAALKKEKSAFEKAKGAWEREQKENAEALRDIRHQLIDDPGNEELRHQLIDAQFNASQGRKPPQDVRDVAETLKRARETERKARQELARAKMRWNKVKSDSQAVHEVYSNIEKSSGLRLESLDPASKDILRKMASDAPEELVDNVFGRVFRGAQEPVDASLSRIEALEKAFGKNSGVMRSLQIQGAKKFLESAMDQASGDPKQFGQIVEQLGPGTVEKLFGNPQAYRQLMDLSNAVAINETMRKRPFGTPIKLSVLPSGLLFFFPMGAHTGSVEKAAVAATVAGTANVLLEWDRITDKLLRSKVPLITKYIRELSTNPDAGRFGNVLSKQVHRYLTEGELSQSQKSEQQKGPIEAPYMNQ